MFRLLGPPFERGLEDGGADAREQYRLWFGDASLLKRACQGIRTPMYDTLPERQRAALFAAIAERNLTKTVGGAEHIAATHLYLMENTYVTGTVLTVDGGFILT